VLNSKKKFDFLSVPYLALDYFVGFQVQYSAVQEESGTEIMSLDQIRRRIVNPYPDIRYFGFVSIQFQKHQASLNVLVLVLE
jgi:hypothetical protein